jgi:hypothetical protein
MLSRVSAAQSAASASIMLCRDVKCIFALMVNVKNAPIRRDDGKVVLFPAESTRVHADGQLMGALASVPLSRGKVAMCEDCPNMLTRKIAWTYCRNESSDPSCSCTLLLDVCAFFNLNGSDLGNFGKSGSEVLAEVDRGVLHVCSKFRRNARQCWSREFGRIAFNSSKNVTWNQV